MVVLNECLTRIRDLFEEDIFKCQAGEGDTAPVATDTGLETPDSNTLLTPSNEKSGYSIQITHSISSVIGSGNTYTEQEVQLNSGNVNANRIVHEGITKGSNDEFTYITTWHITSGS